MLHVGNSRFVLIIGPLVLKFPRIRLFSYLGTILHDVVKGNPFSKSKSRKPFFWGWFWFKMIVLGGIMENLREAKCYFHTKHKLLARLYLPLIVVNVYRRENGAGNFNFGGDELTYAVQATRDREYLKAILPCSHTFDHPENFSYDGNHVKILDYGEEGVQNLLTHHGNQIEELLLSVANHPV